MVQKINNKKSFSLKFDLLTGLSPGAISKKRLLSDMKGMYYDKDAYEKIVVEKDAVVYEFYDLNINPNPENLSFGTTILYPGKVGDEYYMTKGHFHDELNTAEIYYCLRGFGYLLMEDQQGRTEIQEFKPSISVYVPPGFAHRSINTSNDEPLITFFVYRADAGHDYKTIEEKGFRKLIIEKGGQPTIIDNPKWNIQKTRR
ncbi:MAG: Glucose-6-phosphate isomerase [Promethearchaeota archaeon]|nr:MAG: Glucose-6-phosphate isomerase [Candidatus Lokiarchaeota archaeon]